MITRAGSSSAVSKAACLLPEVGTPLYVHLPFCVEKCTYCDFFSVKADGQDLAGTVDSILTEAARRAPSKPRTVFLGGGTPSLLPESELIRLFEGLERCTEFRASAVEVTVECNPESLTLEKAVLLRELGANRLSIGFQSLDARILQLFGRVHTVDQSFSAFADARAAGFTRVNVDLIYAVPGQTLDTWLADLERVLALRPEHVSAYSLAFEEGTVLTNRLLAGQLARLPEDEELRFFRATRASLSGHGYEPYEISNFSLSACLCVHNLNYWRNGPYVGIGPSAVSQIAATRFGNPRSIDAWRRKISAGFAACWEESLPAIERLGETWWLGLRTAEGVDPVRARDVAGLGNEERDPAESLAQELVREGFLEGDGQRYRLSERGLPLADAVSCRFLEACTTQVPKRSAARAS